jgi:hypothetical protein
MVVVAEVAQSLRDLKNQIISIGSAVVHFYADDPAMQ